MSSDQPKRVSPRPSLIEVERNGNGGDRHEPRRGETVPVMELDDAFLRSPELLRLLYASVENCKEASVRLEGQVRIHGDVVEAAAQRVRDSADNVSAIARSQEHLASEVKGSLAGATRIFVDHAAATSRRLDSIDAALKPVLETRSQFGVVKKWASVAAIALGSAGGMAVGVEHFLKALGVIK
jgi:hypothetical protein